jgi:two-component system, NarL family, sensor kinase
VEQAAYRVAQLAIANAVQHASAERITVRIDEDADYVHLQVVDDGVGIDDVAARTALARGHVGLAAMRSEATEVRARIDVRSAPDEGTTVLFLWRR